MTLKKNKLIEIVKTNWKPILILFVAVMILTIPLFNELIFGTLGLPAQARSDYQAHILLIIDGLKNGVWPSYPFYHLFMAAITLGSQNNGLLSLVTVFVMALFIAFKAIASYFFLHEDIKSTKKSFFVALALVFLMPIFNWWSFHVYIGQIAMNVWHNPTTIVAMPFSIILFYFAYKKMNSKNILDYWLISALVVLNLLSKPSYLLVFLPVYFCFLFINLIKTRNWTIFKGMIVIGVVSVAVLMIQFLLMYGSQDTTGSGIIFTIFGVWRTSSPNIPASLLLSVAFPLTYVILYFSDFIKDTKLQFAWAVFFLAIMEFSLLAESGFRFSHGNFGWGSIMSLYILFLTTATSFFAQKKSNKSIFVLIIFMLHLLAGAYYYLQIFTGRGYF